MARFKNILSSFICLVIVAFTGCRSKATNNRPAPASCGEHPGDGKMFVFIGEKISVRNVKAEPESMDGKFVAKYKILETICGTHKGDLIEFVAYDHYGWPAFSDYRTVMLYVLDQDSVIYHVKYMFHPLFKANDGRWASPYPSDLFNRNDSLPESLKPVPIDFLYDVTYEISGLKKQEIKEQYPAPYYRYKNDRAIAVYGNYVPELFEQHKLSGLRIQGYFGVADPDPAPVEFKSFVSVYEVSLTKPEINELTITWDQFVNAIDQRNGQQIKNMSFDSVTCSVCEGFRSPDFYNDEEPIDSFIWYSKENFPGTNIWENIKGNEYIMYATKYEGGDPAEFNLPPGKDPVVYEIAFEIRTSFNGSVRKIKHRFQFVKTGAEFKFFGMHSG